MPAPTTAQLRAVAASNLAAHTTPGVEPGVTGKEKQFQQSKQFGPGPIKPYPDGGSTRTEAPRVTGNDGVYRGGAKAKAIPPSRGRLAPESHRGERSPQGGRNEQFLKPNGRGEQTV